MLDGEIVIAGANGLDFSSLLLRIHPAASRVAMLAREMPASFVAWDLLAEGDENLLAQPLVERRRRLEAALAGARPPVYLTPATRDRALARWNGSNASRAPAWTASSSSASIRRTCPASAR